MQEISSKTVLNRLIFRMESCPKYIIFKSLYPFINQVEYKMFYKYSFTNKMRLRTVVLVFLLFLASSYVHSETIFENFFNEILNSNTTDIETSRKKKKGGGKYLTSLLWGSLLVKSIIFPLAFKAMAVMSSVAVMLSTLSLIISSIVGYAKVALKPVSPSLKVVHKGHYNSWAKDDTNLNTYYNRNTDDHNIGLPSLPLH